MSADAEATLASTVSEKSGSSPRYTKHLLSASRHYFVLRANETSTVHPFATGFVQEIAKNETQ
jgi:hypothetical protein